MKKSFEDILARKLADTEITPPIDGFSAIEGQLSGVLADRRRKRILYRWSSIAAAAACVLALLLLGQFNREQQIVVAEYIEQPQSQQIEQTELAGIIEQAKSVKEISTEEMLEKIAASTPALSSNYNKSLQTQTTPAAVVENIATTEPTQEPAQENATTEEAENTESTQSRPRYAYENERTLPPPPVHLRPKQNKDFVANIFVGALASAGSQPFSSSVTTASESSHNLTETLAVNTLQTQSLENFKHDFPITFGINVARHISDSRLSIASGLSYSLLKSTATMSATYDYKVDQQVHYLGIPLRVNYSLNSPERKLDIYLSTGGSIEMALRTKQTTTIYNTQGISSSQTERFTPSGVMFSAGISAGLAYDFDPHFGLFFEPGVNYYFQNENHPTTYRSDDKAKFDMRIGLRTHF